MVAAEQLLQSYFYQWREHIMKETRSRSISIVDEPSVNSAKTWDIMGKEVAISIRELQLSQVSQAFSSLGFLSNDDIITLNQAGIYDMESLDALSSKEIMSVPGLRIAEAMKIVEHLKKSESAPVRPVEAPPKKDPAAEKKGEMAAEKLEPGMVYMSLSDPGKGQSLLRRAIEQGMKPLLISRTQPDKHPLVAEMDESSMIWLSSMSKENSFNPRDLHRLEEMITDRLQRGRAAVLIEGMEYIITNNEFLPVLRLLQNLRDFTAERKGVLIVTIKGKSLEEHELSLIEKESDRIV